MKAPANVYVVAATADRNILIVSPPRGPMKPCEALALAAWLVAVAERYSRRKFAEYLRAVRNV